MYEELEGFDPVWSMAQTVELVRKALVGVDPEKGIGPEEERLIRLVESKIAEAEDWYERPLDSPEVYEKLVEISRKRGDDDKAEAYRSRIAMFKANEIEFLGRQQEFFGNSKEALRHYEEALEHSPDHPLAFPGREKAIKAIRKAQEAIPRLREKVERKPDSVKAWYDLGLAQLHVGDLGEAAESMDHVLALEPDNVKALCKRGSVIASKGDFEGSLEYFEKALGLQPTSNTAKRGESYALYNLGRLE